LFADVPFTRPFLRTQSRVFHDAVVAGTPELPPVLCRATQHAIAAAEDQIRVSCHRLVESHLYMVHLMAQEYRAVGIPDEDVNDLIQDGSLGLLAAAARFDVRAGASFRTYAMYWLRQAVTRSLRTRRIVLPPRAQQRIARQLTRKTRQLEQLLTRAISPDELAAATGLLPRDIAAAFATQRREISLDAPLGDGRSWAEVLAAPDPSSEDNERLSREESAYMARLRRGGRR
jgi:RNA polymerase sigma factor (sigma-70 family)